MSTAWLHCPLVVCLSCATADFFLCHSCQVALLSQSYSPTRPTQSLVVTRPFTGVRDVHLLGFVVLFCLGTRSILWWETSSVSALLFGWRPSSLVLWYLVGDLLLRSLFGVLFCLGTRSILWWETSSVSAFLFGWRPSSLVLWCPVGDLLLRSVFVRCSVDACCLRWFCRVSKTPLVV